MRDSWDPTSESTFWPWCRSRIITGRCVVPFARVGNAESASATPHPGFAPPTATARPAEIAASTPGHLVRRPAAIHHRPLSQGQGAASNLHGRQWQSSCSCQRTCTQLAALHSTQGQVAVVPSEREFAAEVTVGPSQMKRHRRRCPESRSVSREVDDRGRLQFYAENVMIGCQARLHATSACTLPSSILRGDLRRRIQSSPTTSLRLYSVV